MIRLHESWHKKSIALKHLPTVSVEIPGQGIANGKREYSSITVGKFLFHDEGGNGPSKSMLNCSIGRITLIRFLY